MKPLRLALALVLAVAGTAVMFWLMRHGINYQDEPYQMLSAAEYLESPLAPLFTWVGHAWGNVVGFNLLNFRALSAVCVLLSLALPCLYLYRRIGNAPLALAIFGIGSAWLAIVPAKGYLYGWDSMSTLFIVAVATLCISYLHRQSLQKIALIGIFTSMAVLSRLPNVVIVPVVLAVVLNVTPRPRKCRYTIVLSSAILIPAIVGISVIYGSIAVYAESLSQNVITGHGLSYLLEGYWRTLPATLQFSCYVGAILLISRIFPTAAAMAIPAVLLVVGSNLPTFPFYSTPCHMSSGLLVVSLIYLCRNRSAAIILTLSALCATVGSDMGLEKMITIQFIPLILAESDARRRHDILRTSAVAAFVTFCVSIPVQAENTFEDRGFRYTDTLVSTTPFAGIYTTSERAQEIAALDSIISSWRTRGGDVLIIGDCFHFAPQLIAGTPRPAAIRHDYLIDYQEYVPKVETLITDKPLMVIASNPFDWRYSGIRACDRFPTLRSATVCLRLPHFEVYTVGDIADRK